MRRPVPGNAGARSGRARRGVVFLATLAFTLLLADVGLRFYLLRVAPEERRAKYARPGDLGPERPRYVPHPYLCYALNPAFRSLDGLDRHNALGFRGAEITREKPPGTYRIAVVGGSTVYDTEIRDHRESFPAQLDAILAERGHPEVEVVNAGVGGYTSFETLVDVALRVLEIEPDLLVIYHNTNDVHARLVPDEAFRPDNSGYRRSWIDPSPWWDRSMILRYLGVQWGFSPRNTLEEHSKVAHAETGDPESRLAANSTVWFVRNTEEMIVLARHRGAAVMLTSFASCPGRGGYAARPEYRRGFAENDAAMEALARRMDVPYYDFAADMPQDLELWDDGVHNTAAGARVKAELFATFIAARFLAGRNG